MSPAAAREKRRRAKHDFELMKEQNTPTVQEIARCGQSSQTNCVVRATCDADAGVYFVWHM
jgi:hypothetical protein